MAAGSKEEDGMMGLIREAMALRVKYRLQKATGVKIDKKNPDAYNALREQTQPWGQLSASRHGTKLVDQHI